MVTIESSVAAEKAAALACDQAVSPAQRAVRQVLECAIGAIEELGVVDVAASDALPRMSDAEDIRLGESQIHADGSRTKIKTVASIRERRRVPEPTDKLADWVLTILWLCDHHERGAAGAGVAPRVRYEE